MKLEWKTCLRAGVTLFLLYLAIQFWPAVTALLGTALGAAAPLLLGCALAYVLNIPMSIYERYYFPNSTKKWVQATRRGVCMVGAMLSVVVVMSLVISLALPQFVSCVALVFAQLPKAIGDLILWLGESNLLSDELAAALAGLDWSSRLGEIAKALTSGVTNVVGLVIATASSLFSALTTALFGIIFAIYLLAGKETLAAQARRVMGRYLPRRLDRGLMHVLSVVHDCFHRFIVGQCTEAVILGLLCTGGMLILRLPYATMVGTLIAFTALIPVVGAYVGGGVGAFVIFMASPVQAVIFLVFLVILQQLEGNLVYPRVVGTSIGLPGIWVLAAVTLGGGVFGVAGMLLGVPLAAAAYRLLREDLNRA